MNIYDIADKAGVSIATVSRVINNDKKVSKSTRDRVQKIIENNNFIKKSDYSRHTNNTIVYMCSGTDSGDMADKITYLSDALYKSGYKTAIACCNQDETAKKNMLERYLSENFSGIIIDGHDFLTYSIEENINLLKEITIPSVIINGYFDNVDNVNLCYVNNNISSFIENIAKEYIRKEKKKILFLFERMSFGVKNILTGLHNAYDFTGMDADPDFTQLCRDMSYVEKYINTLIDKEKIPDVVLCKSEKLAAYASIILQKKNYKIPEDIEILCVGDSEICSLVKPQLTSVDIKSKEICDTVINVLIGKINKKTVPVISIINVELLKRESTL